MSQQPQEFVETTEEVQNTGRTAGGTFAEGNPGGPGNPYARKSAALKNRLMDRMTPEVFEELCDVLYEKARNGERWAMDMIMKYNLGRPTKGIDPDRVDYDEFLWHQQSLEIVKGMKELIRHPEHDSMLVMIRILRQLQTLKTTTKIGKRLTKDHGEFIKSHGFEVPEEFEEEEIVDGESCVEEEVVDREEENAKPQAAEAAVKVDEPKTEYADVLGGEKVAADTRKW